MQTPTPARPEPVAPYTTPQSPSTGSGPGTSAANGADARQGLRPADLRKAFMEHVEYTRGTSYDSSTPYDKYMALAHSVRDRLARSWVRTQRRYNAANVKRAYYLSAEYLLGRALGNNLINLGLWDVAQESLREAGVD